VPSTNATSWFSNKSSGPGHCEAGLAEVHVRIDGTELHAQAVETTESRVVVAVVVDVSQGDRGTATVRVGVFGGVLEAVADLGHAVGSLERAVEDVATTPVLAHALRATEDVRKAIAVHVAHVDRSAEDVDRTTENVPHRLRVRLRIAVGERKISRERDARGVTVQAIGIDSVATRVHHAGVHVEVGVVAIVAGAATRNDVTVAVRIERIIDPAHTVVVEAVARLGCSRMYVGARVVAVVVGGGVAVGGRARRNREGGGSVPVAVGVHEPGRQVRVDDPVAVVIDAVAHLFRSWVHRRGCVVAVERVVDGTHGNRARRCRRRFVPEAISVGVGPGARGVVARSRVAFACGDGNHRQEQRGVLHVRDLTAVEPGGRRRDE